MKIDFRDDPSRVVDPLLIKAPDFYQKLSDVTSILVTFGRKGIMMARDTSCTKENDRLIILANCRSSGNSKQRRRILRIFLHELAKRYVNAIIRWNPDCWYVKRDGKWTGATYNVREHYKGGSICFDSRTWFYNTKGKQHV